MCDFISPIIAAATAIGSTVMASKKSKTPDAPVIQSYTPDTQQVDVSAPPAPTAAPTFGQKSAEDMQKDAANSTVKKNKKGRNALVINRDTTGAAGSTGGALAASGTVVPKG